MDRTQSFREAVRAFAEVDPHYDEAALNKINALLLLPKNLQKSAFLTQASKILSDVHDLQTLLQEHQRDYLDTKRFTDKDRDTMDDKVIVSVNTLKRSIDHLKETIEAAKKSVNVDYKAHLLGIVLILSERLRTITSSYDALRTSRCKQVLQKRATRRRPIRRPETSRLEVDLSTPNLSSGSSRFQMQETVSVTDETRLLQEELSELLDSVEAAERKALEVSALNHIFMTHVQKQTQQIELLYDEALQATSNISQGNKELVKAIERSSSGRTYLIMFFIIASLSLLYLDWYKS